jgi:hypothetical protein
MAPLVGPSAYLRCVPRPPATVLHARNPPTGPNVLTVPRVSRAASRLARRPSAPRDHARTAHVATPVRARTTPQAVQSLDGRSASPGRSRPRRAGTSCRRATTTAPSRTPRPRTTRRVANTLPVLVEVDRREAALPVVIQQPDQLDAKRNLRPAALHRPPSRSTPRDHRPRPEHARRPRSQRAMGTRS